MNGSPHPREDVTLPESVEQSIKRICVDKNQPPLKIYARKMLAEIGEEASVQILNTIRSSNTPIKKSFSGFVSRLVKTNYPNQHSSVIGVYNYNSPQPMGSPSSVSPYISPHNKPNGGSLHSPLSSSSVNCSSNLQRTAYQNISCQLSFEDETQEKKNPSIRDKSSHAGELKEMAESTTVSPQFMILNKLEYRKLFLVLSYIGRKKLEEVLTQDDANEVYSMRFLPMRDFENEIWNKYGHRFCHESDRSQYLDWDSGKTHLYYCHVTQNGSYYFKIKAMWIKRILEELKFDNLAPIKVHCDNKVAISIAYNPVLHDRTKHMEVDKHFIKEKLNVGTICMPYLLAAETADVLTKGLHKKQFDKFVGKLTMEDISKPPRGGALGSLSINLDPKDMISFYQLSLTLGI